MVIAPVIVGKASWSAVKSSCARCVAKVLYSYSIGFVYILAGLLCVGGLGPAMSFCSEVSSHVMTSLHRKAPAAVDAAGPSSVPPSHNTMIGILFL